jgi:hypothetical protein
MFLSDNEVIALARSAPVVSGWRFFLELFTFLFRGIFTMNNQTNQRAQVLLKLNADMRNKKVTLEVHPSNNKPAHIMKGVPYKSWLSYVLKVGDWSAEGTDFDALVAQAYEENKQHHLNLGV